MVIREIKGLENGYFENIEGTSEWYYSHVLIEILVLVILLKSILWR